MFGGLRANSIGLREVVFQSITFMAPAGAIAFGLGVASQHAGAALPLSVVIALVVCTLVALNIGALAKHLPSAGGYFTYVSRALGPHAGWLVGWLLGFAYLLFVPGAFLAFAIFLDSFLKSELGLSLGPYGWIAYVLVLAASTFALTFLGIKTSTVAGIILGTIEVAIFAVLAIWIVAAGRSNNTAAAFDPASSPHGWHGVLYGVLFIFGAFGGFESAATLGEESRAPRRVVPRAILLATLGIGLLFAACSYAAVVGWGFENMSTYGDDVSPWYKMATGVWGRFGFLAAFAVLNSGFGNTIAAVNAGARLFYAMGRIDVIPRTFGRTSRFDTPNALVPIVVAGTVVAVALGLGLGPFQAFIFLFALAIVPLLLVYVATYLSVPRFYWCNHRDGFRIVRHVILPIAPTVVIAGVLYLQFVPVPAAPLNLVGPINAVWLLLGIAIVTMVGRRAPQALAKASVVFGGEAGPRGSGQ